MGSFLAAAEREIERLNEVADELTRERDAERARSLDARKALGLAQEALEAALVRATALHRDLAVAMRDRDEARRETAAVAMAGEVQIRAEREQSETLAEVLRHVARVVPLDERLVGYESGGSPWWSWPTESPPTWHHTLPDALLAAGRGDWAAVVNERVLKRTTSRGKDGGG